MPSIEEIDPLGEGLTALIPLDGTELSESALSLLPVLMSLGFEKIKLVSVWEHLWAEEQLGRGDAELKEVAERGRSYLGGYLSKQAERVKRLGFAVDTVVRTGRAAEETLRLAAEDSVDLVLIATHGQDGLTRWRLGSVADKIVRQATCPTLVIGPNVVIGMAPYLLRRILVPLDGSAARTSMGLAPIAASIGDGGRRAKLSGGQGRRPPQSTWRSPALLRRGVGRVPSSIS